MDETESSNFQLFRECLSTPLIEKSSTTPEKKTRKARGSCRRKTAIKPVTVEEPDDAEELADFIDYIAQEIFTNLPSDLRTLTYSAWLNTPSLQFTYTDPLPTTTAHKILDPLPGTITDTLTTYSILNPTQGQTTTDFLTPILATYISSLLTPPPRAYLTRPLATESEICDRSWIPLTYHHLIPRGVHAKVLKRGWHTEDQLENVAWLCRACHSFVHRVATLEELAREWYTVERLLEREDVRDFAKWVGRVRWKTK
ncbi:hypothetical protein EG329_007165 [Mollisiaceae sp. DMI_Dod_QoI]|nr:hypothetical protein EG329_007165 [Helotiales sp. DMI_Dod_QoI]